MNRPKLRAFGSRLKVIDTRRVKPPQIKVTDDYYGTPEHKAWALEVKRRAGWRCEWIQDGARCWVKHPDRLFADHIIERKDDPSKSLDLENGRALCGAHHSARTHAARVERHKKEY